MKPHKFAQSYKCDCFQPYNYCTCSQKIVSSKILIENVNDVAESLVDVMNLCGIYLTRAKASIDVVIYYFLHFEEIVTRVDSIPRKRLNKEDLIHDFGRKCEMSRREAQMAYSIVKRAFKAFYHGTDIGGVPNVLLIKKLKHTNECVWLHAAKRTAQIYASYEGLFFCCQKDLQCKIKLIYNQLYDRINKRSISDEADECTCRKCFKRITKESLKKVGVTTSIHRVGTPYEAMYLKEQKEMLQNENQDKIKVEELKPSCSCSSINITVNDYAYRAMAEASYSGSSQDPFHVQWFPVSKEEYEADDSAIEFELPAEFPCSPCQSDNDSADVCNSDCDCTCKVCTCKSDDDIDCGELQVEVESAEGDQVEIGQDLLAQEDFEISETDSVCLN